MIFRYIVAFIAVVIIGYVILQYNRLITKKNKVNNAWSQIEIQLKRRFDLIPNMIETVKGYMVHERETLEKVAEIRSKFMTVTNQQEALAANQQMSNLLNRLFAVAENYPELKANTGFQQLQQELARTEDKISFSRQFYNDVVMELNNSIQMFPGNLIAGLFRFKPEAFIQIEEEQKDNITVSF